MLEDYPQWKTRLFWFVFGLVILTLIWMISTTVAFVNECCPPYHPNFNETINYDDLLREHGGGDVSFFTWDNPVLAFLVFNVLAGIFIVLSPVRWFLACLLIPIEVPVCCMFVFPLFLRDRTTLVHIDTEEFDSTIYHLTLSDNIAGGLDVFYNSLILYECDETGDTCRPKAELRDNIEVNPDAFLQATSNQLQVIYDDEIIYSLDKEMTPNSAEP